MDCLVCNKTLDDFTPLCENHAPAWGKVLRAGKLTIIPGELKLRDALVAKFMQRTLARWWLGTDVLLLHTFPVGRGKLSVMKFRLIYHLTKLLVDENWVTADRLNDEFISCGGQRSVVRYHIYRMLTEKLRKLSHSGINIAYYDPYVGGKSKDWKYGVDIIQKVMTLFPKVNWIRLDGSLNMKVVYPILDGYLRPSRHDGRPRIVEECKIQGVPFYYSEDRQPNLDKICEFVERVKNANR